MNVLAQNSLESILPEFLHLGKRRAIINYMMLRKSACKLMKILIWIPLLVLAFLVPSVSTTYAGTTDSTVINLVPSNPTPQKYCCITYLDNPATIEPIVVTSSNMNSYSTRNELYNCPPGTVAISSRLDTANGNVYGVYCSQLITKCNWIPATENSLSVIITFWYYRPNIGAWFIAPYTYTATCN